VTVRKLHRIVGIVMLAPFVAWAITGAIFFIKPGYGGAYEALDVKAYPLDTAVTLPSNPAWLEARYVKTVLGDHLLVRTASGWKHLDAKTFEERPAPDESALRTLLADAFTANPERYGRVARVDGLSVTTDTGMHVTLNWPRLALAQRGPDTDRIDGIYKIHYLQWTGIAAVDKILGAVGLILIVVLSGLGVVLIVRRGPVN
jgi:uncharacterized iron-regulated membrane protein